MMDFQQLWMVEPLSLATPSSRFIDLLWITWNVVLTPWASQWPIKIQEHLWQSSILSSRIRPSASNAHLLFLTSTDILASANAMTRENAPLFILIMSGKTIQFVGVHATRFWNVLLNNTSTLIHADVSVILFHVFRATYKVSNLAIASRSAPS